VSDASVPVSDPRWERLPAWLRPRDHELRGRGELRLVETLVLILVGLVLAVATVNDLARQATVNHRLDADLRTWRRYTHHDYRNIAIDQETLGLGSDREVLCGNTTAGAPGAKTQLCLAIWGPVHDGVRTVHGGWYVPPYLPDSPAKRYGCFGPAGQGRCPA
jgi:hypothetical protein